MDFNDAAVFVKVVQAGGFSPAARVLGLPVSTVSTRVARLERHLGITLLQRTTRRLHLTDAGNRYFAHAVTGLGHLLDAEAAATETAGEPQGLLRVTAPADLGDHILAEVLERMGRECPQVQIEMLLLDRHVDLVGEGVDAAIRTGALKDSSLIAKHVGTALWAPFASPAYLAAAPALRSPQALRRHRCLQFTALGRESWTLASRQERVTVPLTGQVLVDDIGVLRALALAAQGVALLPTYLCQRDCTAGGLLRVLPKWHAKTDSFQIVYPRQRFAPLRLRRFVEIAAAVLRGNLEDS